MPGLSTAARAKGFAGLSLVLGMGAFHPAAAQSTLHEALFGGRSGDARGAVAPPVARYVAGEDRAFVLDRSGRTPLLRYEDGVEVWVLRPAPGPRGDVIYRDDLGRQVVRVSRLGGMTLFTQDRPGGYPAALAGQAAAIRPAAISPSALLGHFVRQAVRSSRAAGRSLRFETASDATLATSTLFADAATLAAEAITRVGARRDGARLLSPLRRVRIAVGAQPAAALSGDALQITIAPRQGLAGRPSSDRIARALTASP